MNVLAQVIGTCSLCSGPVTRPLMSVDGTPYCSRCGAKPKTPHGPTIEMVRPACKHPPPFVDDGVCKACGAKA